METDQGFGMALLNAELSYDQGGIPIGACLISSSGAVLACGYNMRVQRGSPTSHAEIAALENAGRLEAGAYKGSTMYTTLAPCDMCAGACLLFGVGRVVVGEDKSFPGSIQYLRQRGVEVVVLDSKEARGLMEKFMREKPEVWNEDIGVES